MKLPRLLPPFCMAVILFLFYGCNDGPDSVGAGTQPSGDFGVIQVDTLYATGHSSLKTHLYSSTSKIFMLGKYKSYEAWACLGFATWPDSMIGVTVTGATIRLRSAYHFGRPMSSLPVNIYRARANWSGTTLTFDSLYLNSAPQSVYGYYYDINSGHSATIQAGDTDWVTISIQDTSMLREWFSTNTDTLELNSGLVIRPDPSNAIRGFYTYYSADTSYMPALYVNYISENGIQTYEHKISYSRFVTTADYASIVSDPKLVYIQSGISYRGLISFDSLLSVWPVSIHRAVLEVTLNKEKSSSSFSPFSIPFSNDSLYAFSVGQDSTADGSYYALCKNTTDSYGNTVYSFEAASLANLWHNNFLIRKVTLSGYSESTTFDLFTLYGEAAEKNLRPRIIITYSAKR
ncbi:MAG: hypothetical protein JXA06_02490 [Bacteroidetes bacterium]|nr:hypothetical protein [Bacteroidota bacterium]